MPTEIQTVGSSKCPVHVSKPSDWALQCSELRLQHSLTQHTTLSGMGSLPPPCSLLDLAFTDVAGYFQNSSQAQDLGASRG